MSLQQAQDPCDYDASTEEDEGDETNLSSSVVPQYITVSMSVENVVSYLKEKGIPGTYCDAFKGRYKRNFFCKI